MSRALRCAVVVLAGLVLLVPSASAGQATLWGCHGPAGQPLGSGPFTAVASGDGGAETFAGGCSTAAGALDDGGLRAAFTRADPTAGSAGRWQAEIPDGLAVSQVQLIRRTSGFGGAPVPGGAQAYVAGTAHGPLESSSVEDDTNAPLDGAAAFATTGGSYVRFGLSCGSTSSGRCAAPSATPLAVDVGAVAVTASDTTAPRGAVGGITDPASGTMVLNLRATDSGIGLASARATLDGVVAASADIGGPGCGDLTPDDPEIDLPLGGGCPAMVSGLELPVRTSAFSDGTHQLQVVVVDAAGNSAVLVDQPMVIVNTSPDWQSSALLTLGTAESPGSPGDGGSGNGSGLVGGAGGVGSGSRSACATPRLSMFLKAKPLRISKGVPVLRRDVRYRYSGTLTCAIGGRRVHARSGLVVSLTNQIGRTVYRRSGLKTRSDGTLAINLAYRSSRLLEFRYMSDGVATRVRIRITVARAAKKKAS